MNKTTLSILCITAAAAALFSGCTLGLDFEQQLDSTEAKVESDTTVDPDADGTDADTEEDSTTTTDTQESETEVTDPCDDVTCNAPEMCVEGECVPPEDPCAASDAPDCGFAGQCVDMDGTATCVCKDENVCGSNAACDPLAVECACEAGFLDAGVEDGNGAEDGCLIGNLTVGTGELDLSSATFAPFLANTNVVVDVSVERRDPGRIALLLKNASDTEYTLTVLNPSQLLSDDPSSMIYASRSLPLGNFAAGYNHVAVFGDFIVVSALGDGSPGSLVIYHLDTSNQMIGDTPVHIYDYEVGTSLKFFADTSDLLVPNTSGFFVAMEQVEGNAQLVTYAITPGSPATKPTYDCDTDWATTWCVKRIENTLNGNQDCEDLGYKLTTYNIGWVLSLDTGRRIVALGDTAGGSVQTDLFIYGAGRTATNMCLSPLLGVGTDFSAELGADVSGVFRHKKPEEGETQHHFTFVSKQANGLRARLLEPTANGITRSNLTEFSNLDLSGIASSPAHIAQHAGADITVIRGDDLLVLEAIRNPSGAGNLMSWRQRAEIGSDLLRWSGGEKLFYATTDVTGSEPVSVLFSVTPESSMLRLLTLEGNPFPAP